MTDKRFTVEYSPVKDMWRVLDTWLGTFALEATKLWYITVVGAELEADRLNEGDK